MSDKGPASYSVSVKIGQTAAPGKAPVDQHVEDRKLGVRELLDKAVEAHRGGQFADAERLYRLVLEKDPDDPNALTNIGTLCFQRGQMDEGIAHLERSLAVKPAQPHALSNLANALTMMQRFEAAKEVCLKAIVLQPDNAEAHNNLGNIRRELGDNDGALEAYEQAFALNPTLVAALGNAATLLRAIKRPDDALGVLERALRADPTYFDAWNEKGNCLQEVGRHAESLAAYEQALALNPGYVEALSNMAVALTTLRRAEEAIGFCNRAIALRPTHADAYNNRGNALRQLERDAEAIPDFRKAIELKPDLADAHNNLGIALHAMRRNDEALAMFDKALALNPRLGEAHANKGNVLRELHRYEEALDQYDIAIGMNSALRDALNNKGITLNEMRRFDDALAAFDQAWAADPKFSDAPWNKSIVYIVTQRYEEGWKHYEWRWKRGEFHDKPNPYGKKPWLGDRDIAGKWLMLTAEQGMGDTLQMLRYAPLLAQKGINVIAAVQNALVDLTRTVPGVSIVLGEGKPLPPWDEFIPTMSLPLAFATTIDTVPQTVPYVFPTNEAKAKWAGRLGPRTKPRVGLVWSGNRSHKNDHNRSLPLRALLPLLDLDAQFVSLQVEYRDVDKAVMDQDGRITNLQGEITSFMDTAALMDQLDLVISVDTSVAHLAGAMGKPLWLLLPYTPDYRWHLDDAHTPWYPTATLVRQSQDRRWEPVVQTLKTMGKGWLETA